MTALLFEVAGQRYGLDIADVIEVVPAVHVRPLPGSPSYVAGVCRYRGTMVPVIDLSALIGGRPSVARLSTRLILVRHPGPSGAGRVLGLLAEHATDGVMTDSSSSSTTGFSTPEAPDLGGLADDSGRTIQFVKVEHLLTDTLRERLFAEEA
jgi:chemotaxis-related protein WspB